MIRMFLIGAIIIQVKHNLFQMIYRRKINIDESIHLIHSLRNEARKLLYINKFTIITWQHLPLLYLRIKAVSSH